MKSRTSLVVQWGRTLCFFCRGHRFNLWPGKSGPTCCSVYNVFIS